jgi:hypothetical protein
MSVFPDLSTMNIDDRIETVSPVKLGHHEFLINRSLGYYPYFSIELRQRVKQLKIINCVVTGEGGVSKSYTASDVCRVLSPKNFSVDDIVFKYPEFLRAVMTSRKGVPIEFDEPSYAMSKKDWYKELTKALVKTIESFRFKGKPLFIPIINKALLEKDIRTYLLQYHLVMKDRGKGVAYRLFPSQFKDKVYSYEICQLKYGLFDNNLCKKNCLKKVKKSDTCIKLNPEDKSKRCQIHRAQYERKKIATQTDRYQVALEESEKQETSKLSLDEIQAKAIDYFDKFYNPDKNIIDIDMLEIVLRRELHLYVGQNKRYRLAKQIRYDHPTLFDIEPTINKDTADKLA